MSDTTKTKKRMPATLDPYIHADMKSKAARKRMTIQAALDQAASRWNGKRNEAKA